MKINKNIIVFYHEHCLDGFASAYVAWKKFKNKADYIALSRSIDSNGVLKNKKIKISDLRDKEIYFIDFCLENEEINKVLKVAKKVVVIDHHESRKELILSLSGSVYGEKISGAYLASQYFFPKNRIPTLIKYISIGDTYTFGQEKFEREILSYLHTLSFDDKTFAKAEKDLEDKKKFLEIKNIGEILQKNYMKLVENQLEDAKLIDFEGHKVYAINASSTFKNDLGHKLSEKTKSFALVYTFLKDSLRISLRGSGKVDLGKIAKKYDGGGHFNAASFRTKDPKFINEFVKKIIS